MTQHRGSFVFYAQRPSPGFESGRFKIFRVEIKNLTGLRQNMKQILCDYSVSTRPLVSWLNMKKMLIAS